MNIDGTDTADTLDGTNADDVIDGKLGDDQITGGQGADKIDGSFGNDTLNGGQGSDTVRGGDGNDRLTDNADGGDDKLSGGSGDDIISVSRTIKAKDVLTIEGGAGADTITFTSEAGSKSKIDVDAGSGADVLVIGEAKEQMIDAGGGNDDVTVLLRNQGRVHGGGGDDVVDATTVQTGSRNGISSGKGADTVTLNLENNAHYRLKLGEGQDVLKLADNGESPSDALIKIKDFAAGDSGDRLDFDAYLTSVLTGTTATNAFADGHLRLIQDGDDAVLQIDLDGSGGASDWNDLIVFQGGNAEDFTAFNFDGLDPDPVVGDGIVV